MTPPIKLKKPFFAHTTGQLKALKARFEKRLEVIDEEEVIEPLSSFVRKGSFPGCCALYVCYQLVDYPILENPDDAILALGFSLKEQSDGGSFLMTTIPSQPIHKMLFKLGLTPIAKVPSNEGNYKVSIWFVQ